MATQPASGRVSYRSDLRSAMEELNLAESRMGFVGSVIAPFIEVDNVGGQYGRIKLASLLQSPPDARNDDGTYNSISGYGNFDTYHCHDRGIEERVDQREAARFRNFWRAESIATERCRDVVLRNRERRVVADALNLTGGQTQAAATVWTDHANATPIADVSSAKNAIRTRVGMLPNAMIVGWEAWENLKQCQQIIDRIKYWGGQDPNKGAMTIAAVAQALDIPELYVAGSQYNTAQGPKATASLADIWTASQALLFIRDDSEDTARPRYMASFHWGEDGSQAGGVIESYYDPGRRSDIVRCRMDVDEKKMYAECAQRLTGLSV